MSPAVIKVAFHMTAATHLATLIARNECLRDEPRAPLAPLPVVVSWQSRFKAAETIYVDYTATTTVGDINKWLAEHRPTDSVQLAFGEAVARRTLLSRELVSTVVARYAATPAASASSLRPPHVVPAAVDHPAHDRALYLATPSLSCAMSERGRME